MKTNLISLVREKYNSVPQNEKQSTNQKNVTWNFCVKEVCASLKIKVPKTLLKKTKIKIDNRKLADFIGDFVNLKKEFNDDEEKGKVKKLNLQAKFSSNRISISKDCREFYQNGKSATKFLTGSQKYVGIKNENDEVEIVSIEKKNANKDFLRDIFNSLIDKGLSKKEVQDILDSFAKISVDFVENMQRMNTGHIYTYEHLLYYTKRYPAEYEKVLEACGGIEEESLEIFQNLLYTSNYLSSNGKEKKERAARSLNKNLIAKRLNSFFHLKESQKEVYFYSISFPEGTADDTCYRLFNVWLSRMRVEFGDYGLRSYLWVAERQQNGTIHYHIFVNQYFDISIANNFMRISIKNSHKKYKDISFSKFENYNGIDIACEKKSKKKKNFALKNFSNSGQQNEAESVSLYVQKYVTKNETQNVDGNNHALWGSSHNLARLFTEVVVEYCAEVEKFINEQEKIKIDRIFRGFGTSDIYSENRDFEKISEEQKWSLIQIAIIVFLKKRNDLVFRTLYEKNNEIDKSEKEKHIASVSRIREKIKKQKK